MLYDYYYGLFMQNKVARQTLEKLVAAGKLTQGEVDAMVTDRKEKYGY